MNSFYGQFISWESNKDTVRYAATAGMVNFVFKLVLCGLRHILNAKTTSTNKVFKPLAAFIAGHMLSIYGKGKWTAFTSHFFTG